MIDITVDTQILMIASGISNLKAEESHIKLLTHIENTETVYLVIDENGLIKQEYENKMRHGSLGKQWLLVMASRGRIKTVKLARWDKGLRTALSEAHFDPDDYKFVRTAMASESKILIAEEDDYSPKVCRILKGKVHVHTASAACQLIEANQPQIPPG